MEYIKNEFRLSMIGVASVWGQTAFMVFGGLLLTFNKYHLMYIFYLMFLPVRTYPSWNWAINYVYQISFIVFAIILYICYSLFMLLTINFSCWEIEVLTHQVRRILDPPGVEEDGSIENRTQKVVERSYRVIAWLKEAQTLMQFTFLVDFSLSSTIICMCLYVLSIDLLGSAILFLLIILMTSQIAVYCWMGNRVNVRIEELADAIYDVEWYSVGISKQKEILIILIHAQNLKGFNGIFNAVNLATLQSVNFLNSAKFR